MGGKLKFKVCSNGIELPAVGQGCMGIGGRFSKDISNDKEQIEALRYGIEKGLTFIDTAEVYGAGHSEELVAEVIKNCRERIVLATKVSPEHLSYDDVLKSAEASLRRLKTDYIDLYQIHWPNPLMSIEATMQAMCKLIDSGKIKYIGVSNFNQRQLQEAQSVSRYPIVSNQVEYNFFDRSIEDDLFSYCQETGVRIIAYSPLDQGACDYGNFIDVIAGKYNLSSSQVILNWLSLYRKVVPIPKAAKKAHIDQNATACFNKFTEQEYKDIDKIYFAEHLKIEAKDIEIPQESNIYKTKQLALENAKKMCPSPQVLAQDIALDKNIKPIRVKLKKDKTKKYILTEGGIRYWAWVIAFGDNIPMPAYVR